MTDPLYRILDIAAKATIAVVAVIALVTDKGLG